jgi:hypothetical protein
VPSVQGVFEPVRNGGLSCKDLTNPEKVVQCTVMLRTDKTTYISIDIEALGPTPGINSMVSLGAAAFDREGTLLDKFMANFKELPDAVRDPSTMEFWQKNPIAYYKTLEDPVKPEAAMNDFVEWYEKLENPVFVFMPQKFDGLFVYWYLGAFANKTFANTPDAIDVKTMAMVALGEENPRFASKRSWPKEWKDKKHKHDHVAVNDAIEQGIQFVKILNELKTRRSFGDSLARMLSPK